MNDMYIVKFITIGGKELYRTESDDLDIIIDNLNQAVIDLNIDRHTSIKESFDELNEKYLTQPVFLQNAKCGGIHMAGGTIDGKYIEMNYLME